MLKCISIIVYHFPPTIPSTVHYLWNINKDLLQSLFRPSIQCCSQYKGFFHNNTLFVSVQYGLLCSGGARAEQTVFSGQSVGSSSTNGVHAGSPPPLLLEDCPTE